VISSSFLSRPVEIVEQFGKQITKVFAVQAFERGPELRLLRIEAVVHQFCQFLSLTALSQGPQNTQPAHTHDVAEHARQLQVHSLEQAPDAINDAVAVGASQEADPGLALSARV
jgi:hypothetical protein